MLKPAVAAVEQLARRGRLLVSERRAPVPEALQGQPVQLAIFPLIQVATAPTDQMRPPERFQFRALARRQSWHDHPSLLTESAVERRSHPESRKQACNARALTENSLFRRENSLLRQSNSLFRFIGKFVTNLLISRINFAENSAISAKNVEIPCFFPV
jgi:hypothetical protein